MPEARGEAVEKRDDKAEESAPTGWNDGTYSYEAPEFDDNGYKDLVNMTIKDGKITALPGTAWMDGKLKPAFHWMAVRHDGGWPEVV